MYSARNITFTPRLTVLRIARQSERSQLHMPPMKGVSNVQGIHHVHIRSMTYGRLSFSAHILVEDQLLSEIMKIRHDVEDLLHGHGINHILLQFEPPGGDPREGIYCESCDDHFIHHKGEGN